MAKVLVVDDSLSVRKVVERALLARQMEVVCAATGSEALERIERDQPDVVVCDVVMPDKDGYEICDFVKRHPRLGRTPVLLMSGIVNDEVRERAARVNSADVLSKPFAADDLLRKLEAVLAVEPPRSTVVEPGASVGPTPALAAPISAPAAVHPNGPAALNGHVESRNGHGPTPIVEVPTPIEPAATPEPPPPAAVAPGVLAPPPPSPEIAPAPPAPAPVAPVPEPLTSARPAASSSETPVTGSTAVLKQFAAIEGVQWAVLADREGFLLDASGDDVVDAAVASALSACLTESSEGLGRELGRGPLQGMILEYAQGMVVLYSVGASALLAIALSEPSALGKIRYFAKKSISELLQAV
jgi:CheY-like chemotaxis protein/predicted regulator of Ras-like GTPase activity (Roadblock/LC7/MglB family)